MSSMTNIPTSEQSGALRRASVGGERGSVVRQLRLRDRRLLAWHEYGDPRGQPVLYCHGTPGSGVEINAVFGAHALAERAGLRLIAPDRPGMGGSTFQPRRTVLSWADDVDQLFDALAVDRYAVLAYSGGAGYATTLMGDRPDRVDRVALLAPAAPFAPHLSEGLDPGGLRVKALARRHPLLARALLAIVMRLPAFRQPELLLRQFGATLPQADRDVLATPVVREGFVAMMQTAFQAGVRGVQTDLALMSRWQVPSGGAVQPVRIWQGRLDTTGGTPAMARALHGALPGSQLSLTEDGHLSCVTRSLVEAVEFLAAGGMVGRHSPASGEARLNPCRDEPTDSGRAPTARHL